MKKLEHSWKALVYDGVSPVLPLFASRSPPAALSRARRLSAGLRLRAPAGVLRQPLPQVHEHEGLQEEPV